MPICFAHEAIELFDQRETKLHLLEPANKCCSNNWENLAYMVESWINFAVRNGVCVQKKRKKETKVHFVITL